MVTQVTDKDYADAIKGIGGVVHVVFPSLHSSNSRFEQFISSSLSFTEKAFRQAHRKMLQNRAIGKANLSTLARIRYSHPTITIISKNPSMII